MFNGLASAGLIAEDADNKAFLQKIPFVFADDKGEPLQHLKVSNANSGKVLKESTQAKQAIDVAINALKLLE